MEPGKIYISMIEKFKSKIQGELKYFVFYVQPPSKMDFYEMIQELWLYSSMFH